MQIHIGKIGGNPMPGDMFDSRVARLTANLNPYDPVPKISDGSDGSLVVDLDGVRQDIRESVLAALEHFSWSDTTVQVIQ